MVKTIGDNQLYIHNLTIQIAFSVFYLINCKDLKKFPMHWKKTRLNQVPP
jgi:hypothetical protein